MLVGYFHRVQQWVGSTWSSMSKCIFYAPLITQANHFSSVSGRTVSPLMSCIPSEGFQRAPQWQCAEFGWQGPSGSEREWAPPPSPLCFWIIPRRKGLHLGHDTLNPGGPRGQRHPSTSSSLGASAGVGASTNMSLYYTSALQLNNDDEEKSGHGGKSKETNKNTAVCTVVTWCQFKQVALHTCKSQIE